MFKVLNFVCYTKKDSKIKKSNSIFLLKLALVFVLSLLVKDI